MVEISQSLKIAIHCDDIRNGGIQRVVVMLLNLLQNLEGHRFILLTNTPPQEGEYDLPEGIIRYTLSPGKERESELQKILTDENVKIFWEHCYYKDLDLQRDLSICHKLGIKIILHHHNVFSNMIARGDDRIQTLFDLYKKYADIMIVLSRADELFFRTIGIPAIFIPNPLTFSVDFVPCNTGSNNILWIGRMVDVKRPLDAVKIIEKISKVLPDVKLILVGDGTPEIVQELKTFITEHTLENFVSLEGFQKDVRKYYETVVLSLITTQFDGYNLTVLESKAFGVPIVHYDLPYLETLLPNEGSVSVPQEDTDAAADTIVKLLQDPQRTKLKILSEQARRSYEKFASFDFADTYKKFFEQLQSGESSTAKTAPEFLSYSDAEMFFKTIVYHSAIGLRTQRKKIYREGAKDKAAEITSGLTWRLGHILLWLPQKIMQFLKGRKDG